jgi:hypothetical protein
MSLDDYQDARWFAVLPGHDRPDVDRVLEHHPGCLVVQKTAEGADLMQ